MTSTELGTMRGGGHVYTLVYEDEGETSHYGIVTDGGPLVSLEAFDGPADVFDWADELAEENDEREAPAQCDQCNALTINGVYCHEHGCPNRS